MNIAVIGWGSLIWCPGSLRIRTRWHKDGPKLPIEFARISCDGRLTLVIHPGSKSQTTYWALSEYGDLQEAIDNLAGREGCPNRDIASLGADDGAQGDRVRNNIKDWLKHKGGIDAAIWTNLEINWIEKRDRKFSPEDALRYLKELEKNQLDATARFERAREYVRNTPEQVQTTVRRRVSATPGWADNKLAESLFEPT